MTDPVIPESSSPANDSKGPDLSSLSSDLSNIEAEYDPQISDERAQARDLSRRATGFSEQAAAESEKAARDAQDNMREIDEYVQHTPSRQAAYATAMHAAPVLSILTALGGKLTRLNGQQMLSATTGIVQGLNESSEQKYQASVDAWNKAFLAMKEHQQQLMRIHSLMLDAYQGRADAYLKAADSARRQTGDLLSEKNKALNERVNLFKAQAVAMDRLDRTNLAIQSFNERVRKDIAQEAHWKALEQKSSANPQLKAQMTQNHQMWTNIKSQIDELMKKRQQVNSNISLPPDIQAEQLKKIDDVVEQLRGGMDKVVARGEELVKGAESQGQPSGGAAPGAPAGGGAPPSPPTGAAGSAQPAPGEPGGVPAGQIPGTDPGAPHLSRPFSTATEAENDAPAQEGSAVPQRPGQAPVSPKRLEALQKNKGHAVTFADQQTWIMELNGQVHRVM